jgi:hypothetical protein
MRRSAPVRIALSTLLGLLLAPARLARGAGWDLGGYQPQPGLAARASGSELVVHWTGSGAELRATFAADGRGPLVRELAVRGPRKGGGQGWSVLARDLRPEFTVTSGIRRISRQQLEPLGKLGTTAPELLEREKWNVFWDAPLSLPGLPGTNPGLPRRPEEIRRAAATYASSTGRVKTDGARLEVTYPGLTLGIFSGDVRFTVYRGTNLLRQEAIARTEEPSVAYKYSAGLGGFRTGDVRRLSWRDVARGWQKCEFGGSPNRDPVALRARHRLALLEAAGGTIAVFPAPHKFFFAREVELNLGYVWYRKDEGGALAIGVRQADSEEAFRPYGNSKELWQKRVGQARSFAEGNFALYNAPPGTAQRMAVYYYLSPAGAAETERAVLAFTHEDRYRELPGYQVAVSHFHTHFHELLLDSGSLDVQPPWIPTFRALGINIAMMSDFHGDGHSRDPGPLRLKEQQAYFEGSRRHSDRDFLIVPGEEPDAHFGGHYTMVFPRPVYWTLVRTPGTPPVEETPPYGRVYHVGSAAEELEMLRRENGLVWQAHPRTKGSSGYPDAIRDTEAFRSDRYLGASFQSLPADLSQARLCEARCFGTLDDMNNWAAPKYLLAEGDTYQKAPEDDTYSHLMVNYVKLDRLPAFDEGWASLTGAIRAGDFFVTSGEVLIRSSGVEGTGPRRTFTAEVEWTFPLEFVEVVWGDGRTVDRQIVRTTELAPFGTRRFRIPLDAAGKKWVRFAAWDSAGNGAFTQPRPL